MHHDLWTCMHLCKSDSCCEISDLSHGVDAFKKVLLSASNYHRICPRSTYIESMNVTSHLSVILRQISLTSSHKYKILRPLFYNDGFKSCVRHSTYRKCQHKFFEEIDIWVTSYPERSIGMTIAKMMVDYMLIYSISLIESKLAE